VRGSSGRAGTGLGSGSGEAVWRRSGRWWRVLTGEESRCGSVFGGVGSGGRGRGERGRRILRCRLGFLELPRILSLWKNFIYFRFLRGFLGSVPSSGLFVL
jgi:hypothetical protein